MSNWFIEPMEYEHQFTWLSERAECSHCEDTKGIVVYRDDQLVGAVAMDSWSYNSCTIHIAIDDMLAFKNNFPEEVFNYIFNTCDKGVVIGVTPADNERALRFNKTVGLVELYRIKDGYEVGVDYVVQELRKENCKYLRIENGQEEHSRAA